MMTFMIPTMYVWNRALEVTTNIATQATRRRAVRVSTRWFEPSWQSGNSANAVAGATFHAGKPLKSDHISAVRNHDSWRQRSPSHQQPTKVVPASGYRSA